MIVALIRPGQHDFYQRTALDQEIITKRIDRLYKNHDKLNAKQGAALLCNAFKDYQHVLPWLNMLERHGSLSIRRA